jgi:hypothetical protein
MFHVHQQIGIRGKVYGSIRITERNTKTGINIHAKYMQKLLLYQKKYISLAKRITTTELESIKKSIQLHICNEAEHYIREMEG